MAKKFCFFWATHSLSITLYHNTVTIITYEPLSNTWLLLNLNKKFLLEMFMKKVINKGSFRNRLNCLAFVDKIN